MKKIVIIAILSIILPFSACKKDKYNTYEDPYWRVSYVSSFTASMTAVISLPDNLKSYVSDGDVLAAFNNGTCRGVATVKDGLFYISILGYTEESFPATIKYWSASNKYMYEANQKLLFEENKIVGSISSPYQLELSAL